ncbi:MAG TPA: hypothetical protein VGO61_07315 [Steroidobacteraceae bacterium]|jgi:hypothetical protein|nr:hypothetical protein [Steroidobacteraceae bacterium]
MKILTSICLRIAEWLLRKERGDWARAMRAELPHLDNEQERFRWAFGCLIAAIKQRFAPMDNGTLRISRWVMFIETIGLFGPLTLAWYEFTFGPSGLVRLNSDLIERNFLSQPGGTYLLILWYAVTITGLIGALGLLLGLRYVWSGQALRNRALGLTLIAILLAPTVFGMVANLIMGPIGPEPNFGIAIMFVVAPAFGLAHLLYLGRRNAPPPHLTAN